MKKIFVFMLALSLAIPAVSFAGSATSRWDLTIGGTVKFQVSYSPDKAAGALSMEGIPVRNSQPNYDILGNKYGNYIWGAGETGLNFGVRGPDVWGAKTSAYVSGDFSGAWGGSGYNGFDLMNANFTLDWGTTDIVIGQQGSIFGSIPTYGLNPNFGGEGWGGKGMPPVAPGIKIDQKIGKYITASFLVQGQQGPTTNNNTLGAGAPNSYTMGSIPLLEGNLVYKSDACGKVGPWNLTIGVDGAYGKEKKTYTIAAGNIGDTDLDMWITDFKFLVPIIPEKNGNKTLAWYVDGAIEYGQNLGGGYFGTMGGAGGLAYFRPVAGQYGSPVEWAWTVHSQFYVTDQISFNGFWYSSYIKGSNWWGQNTGYSGGNIVLGQTAGGGIVKHYNNLTLNVMYEPNPALRFVLQGGWTQADYAANNVVGGVQQRYENVGTKRVYGLTAYYYF